MKRSGHAAVDLTRPRASTHRWRGRLRPVIVVTIAFALLALVAGCSHGPDTNATATSTTNSPATAGAATTAVSSTTATSATVITVSEADNSHTVSAHTGDAVMAVLHSTYWSFNTPSGDAVVSDGPATATPNLQGCVPGGGCGTANARYRVVAAGRATLSAHRDSCGEALRCTGNQGDWVVTVEVVS